MDVLVIYPETKEQLTAYQSMAKAFRNRVVKKKEKEVVSPYDPEFVAKILQGDKDYEAGKGVKVDLKKFFSL